MTIRVLLVDDHAMLRAGLASLLGADAEIEVVGEADDGAAAVSEARRTRPDVVLMAIEMPGVDGITAITPRSDGPEVPLSRPHHVRCRRLLRALRAGAVGFLLKTTPPHELIQAVKDCAAGGSALGPTVVRRLVASYVGQAHAAAPGLGELTEREPTCSG